MHEQALSSLLKVTRYRRPVMASLAIFSIALVGACSSAASGEDIEVTPRATASSSPAVASDADQVVKPTVSAKPTLKVNESVTAKTISQLEKQGIDIGDTVEVKGGSYPQYRVTEKSDLAQFDPSKHSNGTPDGWKKSDLENSQVMASNIMLNMVIDNQTLNDYEANKQLLADSAKRIAISKYKQEFYDAVMNHDAPFLSDNLQAKEYKGDKSRGFRFVSDGETPRIADLSNLEVSSSENWDGGVYYTYVGYVTMNVVDKSNKPYAMEFFIEIGLNVTKEQGEYRVSSVQNLNTKYREPSDLM